MKKPSLPGKNLLRVFWRMVIVTIAALSMGAAFISVPHPVVPFPEKMQAGSLLDFLQGMQWNVKKPPPSGWQSSLDTLYRSYRAVAISS